MKVINIFLSLFPLVISQDTEKCVLSTGEEGNCVSWMGCPAYKKYIDAQRSDPKSAQFLREKICRVELPDVYLCCPQTQSQAPINLAKVTIPTEEECGIRKKLATDEPGSWPWMAAIGHTDPVKGFRSDCAGVLITRRHVLSAAHCFILIWKEVVVRLGEYHLDHDEFGEQPQDYAIMLFSVDHYVHQEKHNDIVILPLDRDVVFTDYIRPVCLPFPFVGQDFADQRLTVTGWGATVFGAEGSRVLNTGSAPVVNLTICRQNYKRIFPHTNITDKMLCAGDDSGDACQGDAGAPLTYYSREKDRFYVVGLVSFGHGCGLPDFPGVNTRVTSYLDFIKRSLNIF